MTKVPNMPYAIDYATDPMRKLWDVFPGTQTQFTSDAPGAEGGQLFGKIFVLNFTNKFVGKIFVLNLIKVFLASPTRRGSALCPFMSMLFPGTCLAHIKVPLIFSQNSFILLQSWLFWFLRMTSKLILCTKKHFWAFIHCSTNLISFSCILLWQFWN